MDLKSVHSYFTNISPALAAKRPSEKLLEPGGGIYPLLKFCLGLIQGVGVIGEYNDTRLHRVRLGFQRRNELVGILLHNPPILRMQHILSAGTLTKHYPCAEVYWNGCPPMK
jgi:hypothetical protein